MVHLMFVELTQYIQGRVYYQFASTEAAHLGLLKHHNVIWIKTFYTIYPEQ